MLRPFRIAALQSRTCLSISADLFQENGHDGILTLLIIRRPHYHLNLRRIYRQVPPIVEISISKIITQQARLRKDFLNDYRLRRAIRREGPILRELRTILSSAKAKEV